jgi:hypothetical protein
LELVVLVSDFVVSTRDFQFRSTSLHGGHCIADFEIEIVFENKSQSLGKFRAELYTEVGTYTSS